ncbi:MAG: hypothetical protein ABW128_07110 [Rhizorhabdus sp.]
MPDAEDVVVWWTTQQEHKTVSAMMSDDPELARDWPEWLLVELSSRQGRNGRGRLWNAQHGRWLVGGIHPWPDTALAARLGADEGGSGGIVLPVDQLPLVIGLPGVVTNARLERLRIQSVGAKWP